MPINEIKNLLKQYKENEDSEIIKKICEILNRYIPETAFDLFHYWDDVNINGYYTPVIIEQRHGYDYAFYPVDENLSQRLEELFEKRSGKHMRVFDEIRKITDKEKQMKILKYISDWYDHGVIGPIIPKSKKELRNFIDKSLKEVSEYDENYGSIITIAAKMDVPCIMFQSEDEIFIGDYYTTIKRHECVLKLNHIDEEVEEIGYEILEQVKIKSLYEQLKEDYESLNENIIIELKKEIIELYNEYKDDIKTDKYGDAECPSEGMLLIDAIWNHAPLFRESIIAHYIVKLHKKELKI